MNNPRIAKIQSRLPQWGVSAFDLFLFVDTAGQELFACRSSEIIASFVISTSALGLGNREASCKTPTGFHRIVAKIGAGAPPGRIFRDRLDTGSDWHQGLTEENLVLTRIMRLEGLEPGLNKGPGIDSFNRYIYIHGTNNEDRIGTPKSHGCVCLRNNDCIRLFDLVSEGTVVFIEAQPFTINGEICSHLHFTGIFGSGMSALAQYLQWQGLTVSGSDRLLASPDSESVRTKLLALGCNLFNQGITPSTDALCISTAIEAENPEIIAATARGIPIFHRSDLLAAIVESMETIAIAGTSGKSTVTAIIFEFLFACGLSPSLISGAPLLRLEQEGLIGNAFSGDSPILVVEADESDGTLVKYRPAASLILNISKDHKTIAEVESFFSTLVSQSGWVAVNANDRGLDRLPAQERFGTHPSATWKPERVDLDATSVTVCRNGIAMRLPLPGSHNAENLCAALCVCEHFGCTGTLLAAAARNYRGVARRFAVTFTRMQVSVVDDFAHNPAKITAAVAAARGVSKRIIAIYQPHGFAPTRFLKNDYIAAFRSIFTSSDSLYLLPIYYAGGTVQKDISSEAIINGLGEVSFHAEVMQGRPELLQALSQNAQSDDCVLLMGARDPSLPRLAEDIIALFGGAVGD